MVDRSGIEDLTRSLQRYFNLMYDCDTSQFDRVFAPTAQLHGFRDGEMVVWPVANYREILAGRKSPKTLNAPREEEILMLDFASQTQALAKVRVRINTMVFVDYLTYHRINGEWLITSKGYHLERSDARATG